MSPKNNVVQGNVDPLEQLSHCIWELLPGRDIPAEDLNMAEFFAFVLQSGFNRNFLFVPFNSPLVQR